MRTKIIKYLSNFLFNRIFNRQKKQLMFWYEDEVKRLEALKTTLENKETVVFYGSSSVRMWDTLEEDFPETNLVNFGFGGSTLAACAWYFKRIMEGVKPKSIIIYAGDNDLGDGRHPEEVFNSFKLLVYLIREQYGNIPIGFISIKPSIQRWNIIDQINYTNEVIKKEIGKLDDQVFYIDICDKMLKNNYPDHKFFQEDGLHISLAGYKIWKETLLAYSSKLL